MEIPFYKYQGAGNDFVIIDQREEQYISEADQSLIERICDRRFGVGGDGLMLMELSEVADFEMIYFNADGRTSSMCGNGGRCIVALASRLGIIEDICTFVAIDGLHEAGLDTDGLVSLKMNDVRDVAHQGMDFVLDTGSPHYVRFREGIEEIDMVAEGRSIRYHDDFKDEGINVNYVDQQSCQLKVRTYERGVEDETYACGTGVVAAAIASAERLDMTGVLSFEIQTKGGVLEVSFERAGQSYTQVWLKGSATYVFQGSYSL